MRAAKKFERLAAEEIAVGLDKLGSPNDSEIIDALELVLYAAAEHTDDLKFIARELAGSRGENPIRAAERMEKLVKPIRQRISMMTNQIKHAQWRIGLLRHGFVLGGVPTILYGVVLLSVSADRVGLEKLPPDGARVIALPSMLWSVLEFLFFASQALHKHLATDLGACQTTPVKVPCFATAVAALARLPNYSMEEEHTFHRLRVVVRVTTATAAKSVDSGLYGSLSHKWDRAAAGLAGGFQFAIQGDGASRSFDFPTLRGVTLQHWD
jgi:hypothetical protein